MQRPDRATELVVAWASSKRALRRIVVSASCFLLMVLGAPAAHGDPELPEVFSKPVDTDSPPPDLNEVTTRLRRGGALTGRFVQMKEVRSLSKPLRSTGTFYFEREKGLCWTVEEPFFSRTIVTPNDIYQRARDGSKEEAFTQNKAILRGFAAMFLAAFGGDAKGLSERFDLYFESEGPQWQLGFLPQRGEAKRMLRYLMLDGEELVSRLTIVNASGDRTTVEFDDVQPLGAPSTEHAACFSSDPGGGSAR